MSYTVEQFTDVYKTITLEIAALKHDGWDAEATASTEDLRKVVVDQTVELLEVIPHCHPVCMAQNILSVMDYFIYGIFRATGLHPENDSFAKAWDGVFQRNAEAIIQRVVAEMIPDGPLGG